MPLYLSDATETTKQKAQQLSMKLGHFYFGAEHFFLSVAESETWVADVLSRWNVSVEEVRRNIINICGPGDDQALWEGIIETPRLKKIFTKYAQREAEDVKAYRVEPCHVVAAMCKEGRSVPVRVLAGLGINLDEFRQLAKNSGASPNEASSPPPQKAQSPFGGIGYPPAGTPYSAFAANRSPMSPKTPPPQQPAGTGPAMPPQQNIQGAGSPPQGPSVNQAWASGNLKEPEKRKKVQTPTLDKLGRDMVQMAKEGKIDPIVGRKDEIRRLLQTLTKKMKNNPIIIGEAGVGKTAVVYGLALRIAEGKVPQAIMDKTVVELSMSSLVAGAKHRGEFEERMEALIKELSGNRDIILFIDEIHTIMGAGDSRGPMNAGNILKPYLARNEITIIGATTIEEYRKYLEKDPALERRFQPILVEEPSEEETIEILNGLKEKYEKHHGVVITPKAIKEAVRMSVRYIPDRNLPDKAIDLIDEAAAKSQMQFTSISGTEELKPADNNVTEENIAEVISLWTGIPASKLTVEESERLLHIEDYIRDRVVGQENAVQIVAQTIRMARMGLSAPNRPQGVFLFLGPTGVGKTELAKSLAEFLFGSEKDLVRLDMSEYMEKHAISRLIGSPPGYVGHEEEGQLTSQVRTRPYSVVLMDEVEKAHPEVFDLFLQVFDDGRLTDSKGRTVNFTNTIIILTSNIGMSSFTSLGEKQVIDTNDIKVRDIIMRELRQHFRPEFINRIDEIIIFSSLNREALANIVSMNLKTLKNQLENQREIIMDVDESVIDYLLVKGYDPAYGARPMKRAIANYLSKPLAEAMLAASVQAGNRVMAWFDGSQMVFEQEGRGEIYRKTVPSANSADDGPVFGDTGAASGPVVSPSSPPSRKSTGGLDILPIARENKKVNPSARTIPDRDDLADTAGRKPPSGGSFYSGGIEQDRQDKPRGIFSPRKPAEPEENPPAESEKRNGSLPSPFDIVNTPFNKRKPVLRQRTKDMDPMGMAPMKGPITGPGRPPEDLDFDDFDETRPGGGPR